MSNDLNSQNNKTKTQTRIKNLYTYIHTYIHIEKERKKRKSKRHTNLSIYNEEDFKKFRQILDLNDDNVSSFLGDVIEIILEQYDVKEHSLDKYLTESYVLLPNIKSDPLKVLKYLQTLPIDELKEYEEKFMQNYTYVRALTQGEIELDNYPYLWRKYH